MSKQIGVNLIDAKKKSFLLVGVVLNITDALDMSSFRQLRISLDVVCLTSKMALILRCFLNQWRSDQA